MKNCNGIDLKYSQEKFIDLETIWKDQAEFNKLILPCDPNEMTLEQRQYWTNMYCLCLHKEISEVLDETPYKPHRNSKPIVRSNLLEELVDVMKYWMCLCQIHEVTSEEILEEYQRKSNVVKQRFFQEKIMSYDGKIAGVDIDGVLADYPRSFVEFVNKELKTNYDYNNIRNYNIAEALGLPPEESIRLKHLYRETGQKRFIPVINGAKQFLEELKYMGYTVVLLTSRPYHTYKRIFGDTQYWLSENKLFYDAILWDDNKGERLLKEFGKDKVEFFVDDVASFANGMSRVGVKCYLLKKLYNEGVKLNSNVIEVNNLNEILEDVKHGK
jgi:uncharacterized HAD superfamily protein/NTP pyrophosphatase (non-canonical NTP hydrolase)